MAESECYWISIFHQFRGRVKSIALTTLGSLGSSPLTRQRPFVFSVGHRQVGKCGLAYRYSICLDLITPIMEHRVKERTYISQVI